jgi:hypothetical protein
MRLSLASDSRKSVRELIESAVNPKSGASGAFDLGDRIAFAAVFPRVPSFAFKDCSTRKSPSSWFVTVRAGFKKQSDRSLVCEPTPPQNERIEFHPASDSARCPPVQRGWMDSSTELIAEVLTG